VDVILLESGEADIAMDEVEGASVICKEVITVSDLDTYNDTFEFEML
jgi:hypothetical protein